MFFCVCFMPVLVADLLDASRRCGGVSALGSGVGAVAWGGEGS